MAVYEIEILNWEKYNPRAEQKRSIWWRCENDFPDHICFQQMNHAQYRLMHWLFCRQSKNGIGKFKLDTRYINRTLNIRACSVESTLTLAASYGVLTYTLDGTYPQVATNEPAPPKGLREIPARRRTLRTNDTNDTNDTYPLPPKGEPTASGDGLGLLAQVWNEECGSHPKVQTMNATRKRICKQRLSENSDPEYWRNVVRKVCAWEFGKTNDRGWRPNFDFLIRPNTHIRASEGQFGHDPTTGRANADFWEKFLAGEEVKNDQG